MSENSGQSLMDELTRLQTEWFAAKEELERVRGQHLQGKPSETSRPNGGAGQPSEPVHLPTLEEAEQKAEEALKRYLDAVNRMGQVKVS